ncbi:MAG: hypothetical protein QF435_16880 [Arenicellales bacterium]|nr:hypothetical protein [Arenicellales bacterium]
MPPPGLAADVDASVSDEGGAYRHAPGPGAAGLIDAHFLGNSSGAGVKHNENASTANGIDRRPGQDRASQERPDAVDGSEPKPLACAQVQCDQQAVANGADQPGCIRGDRRQDGVEHLNPPHDFSR